MSDAPPPGWGHPPGPPAGQGQPPYGQPSYAPQGGYGPGGPGYGPSGYGPTGYGVPPPGPPPSKGRGALIGVVVLVVLLLIGGVGAALLLRNSGEADEVADSAPSAPVPTAPGGTVTVPPTTTTPEPFEPPPSATPVPPVDGTDQSVFELSVGTCFNTPDSADAIQSVGAVPCETPHDNEVFGLVDYPGGPDEPFPGQEPISLFGEEQCQGALFSDYVGIDYINSQYFASQLTPTEGSWEQGDREVVCVLYDTTSQLTGSVQGSGR